MDKVVVDSSVAIKWFIPEPFSAEACRILDGYKIGNLTLLAPDLINAEVGNIVWKKHNFTQVATYKANQKLTYLSVLAMR